MIGWAHTIYAFLHALALASDLAQHWSRDLAPWEVRARLVEDYGAVLPEDMIRPLDEEHDVPDDLPAPLVYEFFESFTAGKEQFADRGFGVGGRQTRGDHPALPTAVFYQLGGEADCGLLAAIVAEYDALMARALGGAELSPDERKWTLMASCVLEYMEAEQERLEMGDTGPKMTRAEQLEQQKLNQRKVKSGVRMMKTGPAKHKFDLEAHNARKNGGLYKTGKEWHEARNSKAAFQAKNAKAGVMCGKCKKRPCACRAKETDSRARQVEKEAKQQKKGIKLLNDKNKKKKK